MKTGGSIWVALLMVGLVLWFGLFTDYSWDNVWANIAFPPICGFVGVYLWLKTRQAVYPVRARWIRRMASTLLMAGGVPYIALLFVALCPITWLGVLFWASEQNDSVLIQRELSPSGAQIAEVYFLPVGAYSGGNGRVEVHLRYPWLPFIKRDLKYVRVSYADEHTSSYVRWVDEGRLFLSETQDTIDVGLVRPDVPAIVLIPMNLFLLFANSS